MHSTFYPGHSFLFETLFQPISSHLPQREEEIKGKDRKNETKNPNNPHSTLSGPRPKTVKHLVTESSTAPLNKSEMC